jgi:dienelactone hydrolase
VKKMVMRALVAAFVLGLGAPAARADVKTEDVNYEDAGVKLKGHLAWDDAVKEKRPAVLIVHEVWGLNDYARKRAEQLAKMGYVAFACDMYGEGKVFEHPDDAKKMMAEIRANKEKWLARATAGIEVLRKNEKVDPKRIAAIGYCFGGSTVLELAFSGADLSAVVSFHGGLSVPESTDKIKAKILICHGADDAFIPKETIEKLKAKLDAGKVSYKFIAYPGAVHSFTVPEADKHGMKGVAYNAEADKKSWEDMSALFEEVFKKKG